MAYINIAKFVLINLTWKRSWYDWNASFGKCCDFYPNDYIMMLHNDKFPYMVYYLKHTTREKFWKQEQAKKRLWYEITARKYKVNPLALNLNHNIEKIIDCNPYFLCFCTVLWFSNILSWFSKIFHASLLLLARRNILFHLILVGGRYLKFFSKFYCFIT